MIIRWVCKKDNKKWLYPINKCIYCKGDVEKQVSKKAKVIGITKVNIPSPLHPIIPYNVILLEDDFGNRMPKKTMKDYKIGDVYEIKNAKTSSAVILKKIKYDLWEALRESLELLDSLDINGGDKVLIKPCIIEPAYPYQAVNTNPKLLYELIKFLKGRGISDIILGEQALPGKTIEDTAKKSEILDICKKQSIKLIDLGKTEYVEREFNEIKFNIAKEVEERKVINVPVMKTNSRLGISGAMENMSRVVDQRTLRDMFANDIEKTLPMLIKILPKFLTIGDATIGMHDQGPTSLGEPAFINMILISKDPVAVDAVFSELGMFSMPSYIREAESIGAGLADVMNLEVVGDELEASKYHLKASDKEATAHPKIKLIDGKADPNVFNNVLSMASKLIGLTSYEINVAIGKFITKEMLWGKKRIIAYGNDAISRLEDLNVITAAQIPEDTDDTEKLLMIKSILENPQKDRIDSLDKIKSKIAGFGAKIKKAF